MDYDQDYSKLNASDQQWYPSDIRSCSETTVASRTLNNVKTACDDKYNEISGMLDNEDFN